MYITYILIVNNAKHTYLKKKRICPPASRHLTSDKHTHPYICIHAHIYTYMRTRPYMLIKFSHTKISKEIYKCRHQQVDIIITIDKSLGTVGRFLLQGHSRRSKGKSRY